MSSWPCAETHALGAGKAAGCRLKCAERLSTSLSTNPKCRCKRDQGSTPGGPKGDVPVQGRARGSLGRRHLHRHLLCCVRGRHQHAQPAQRHEAGSPRLCGRWDCCACAAVWWVLSCTALLDGSGSWPAREPATRTLWHSVLVARCSYQFKQSRSGSCSMMQGALISSACATAPRAAGQLPPAVPDHTHTGG